MKRIGITGAGLSLGHGGVRLAGGGFDWLAAVKAMSPIGLWPINEASGAVLDYSGNAFNGTPANLTQGNAVSWRGQLASTFNGTNSNINLYSVASSAAFNGSEGGVSLVFRVTNAGIWSDGLSHVLFQTKYDNDNQVRLYLSGGRIQWSYESGNVVNGSQLDNALTTDIHVGISWSKSNNRVRFYYFGSQWGVESTGLGVWTGAPTTFNYHIGYTTAAAAGVVSDVVLFDREPTAAEMHTMAGSLNTDSAVMFGDSLTEGAGSSDTAHTWPYLLAAARGHKNWVNKGIGGTLLQNSVQNTSAVLGGATTNNGRDRYATAVLPYNPDWVYLMYGTNDMIRNDVGITLASYDNDLREVIDGILAHGVSANHIVLSGPPYIPVASYTALAYPGDGGTLEKHQQYIAAAAAIAADKGLRYIDMYQWMAARGGDALMSADGIHYNDDGYEQVYLGFASVL